VVNIRITILSGVIKHLLPSLEQKSDEERSSRFLQNAGVYTHTHTHTHTTITTNPRTQKN